MMIAIGSDHAGFTYKERIKELLLTLGEKVQDAGPTSAASTDYPDWGHAVAEAVSTGKVDRGILICGTGIGMSIVANKHKGVRAAVCESVTSARLARLHNDANILCVGERVIGWESVVDIVTAFLKTRFDGGERHARRVGKIHSLTNL
ncbi:MAG: ribose 5-phosphate isomerase B [Ignavibacteria bacterium GWA2_55_11]|nr:MAG: ribose 5-phosphate isomerase B [Ignavibacteria bacterium GWA2_55_11]OGU44641.1 MAG: ribose 5-phosphate isomerase B [Ignavibacteria bacterium GWC2_56_12]OGU62893.1 MAG: ribose 5-phosphate isomerase B [Ignavibacteria bacterium RIFCSPHIGHO2_02_FULL_56_12]OGU68987.1 MAG: ribose 5-phosphate isomerase B [Ignavibacteria bacterium RIFCSPLOWO2_02_FULL_55_14]OGU76136.1 MAG: ribose 5-phosphate isomerase B [Ignavibacteria bacterium RIFCSPLOWO2_12_FULL_56_21]HAV23592.1 ribose 5-phosphate isomerase 